MMDDSESQLQTSVNDNLPPSNPQTTAQGGSEDESGDEDEFYDSDSEYDDRTDDDIYDTSSESEDGGSEWNSDDDSPPQEGETKTTGASQPPLKRVKTVEGDNIAKKQNDRKRPSLSLLVTMPLDILYEIFGRLSSQDLLALAQTSKSFRRTLVSPNAIVIWKAAREQVGAPECPRDMSEPQWAALLFGEKKCQRCDSQTTRSVDFALRRRLCLECFTANVVSSFKFPKRFPNLDETILDLIPHTIILTAYGNTSKCYWKSDIQSMAAQLETFQKNVKAGMIGSAQKLEDFKAERIKYVESLRIHVVICNDWIFEMATQRHNDRAARQARRFDAIRAKLQELGYENQDIDEIAGHRFVRKKTQLTNRIWHAIRPELEEYIKARKRSRLKAERNRVIENRTYMVKKLYEQYKITLKPSQWMHHPATLDLNDFVEFKKLIHAENEVNITQADFSGLMEGLPDSIAAWVEEKKKKLRLIVASSLAAANLPNSSAISDPLELATAVFGCATKNCANNAPRWNCSCRNALIGWKEAITHICEEKNTSHYNPDPKPILPVVELSIEGSLAAAALIALANLGPRTATPEDMDLQDLRFYCDHCGEKATLYGKKNGRLVYTWRSGVAHAMSLKNSPSWKVLSAQDTSIVKKIEGDRLQTISWTCNHCSFYMDKWNSQTEVLEHVKTVHGIPDPADGVDLFHNRCLHRVHSQVAVIQVANSNSAKTNANEVNNIKCLRCTSRKIRLFLRFGVLSHLRSKHQITEPVQGIDWDIIT